tara:strand:- start:3949 stop:4977 length:1029 start_codon:yes stop_codon:yes gene_type:complete
MAIRGSSPVNVNLGMLDTRPAIQANAMVQQANVNLANSVNQAVNNFVQAKEKKENEQISINAIQSILGISDPNLAKAIVKDPAVGKAFQLQQERQQEMNLAMLEAMQGPDPTSAMRNFDFLISQNVPQDEAIERSFGAGGTTVNLPGDPIDDPLADAMRESNILPVITMTKSINETAKKARAGLELLDQGTETGFGETFKLEAKKFLNLLGVGEFDVSNQELFRNQVEPLMMDFVEKTKGAISNAEMNLFRSWSAGLPNTVEGNKKILKAILRAQKNHQGSLKIIQDARREGITDPFVVNQRIQDYLSTKSVLYDNVDEAEEAAKNRGATVFTFEGENYKVD